MTSTTTNLNLITYNNTTDQSGSFITWTQNMSGSVNSNMTKIDNWSGSASGSMTNLNTFVSGSLASISGSMNSISGSLATIMTNITALGLRFAKLDEFSGAGQADFNNISGSYTHLLLMGVACGNYGNSNVDVGIDFNTDANSSNYVAFQWGRNHAGTDFEYLQEYLIGGIVVANVPGTLSSSNYGGAFFALIPNYSVDGSGFYKTGMGISARHNISDYYGGALQGGSWKSTSRITRIRVFAGVGTSTRYSFVTGTKISLYGLG